MSERETLNPRQPISDEESQALLQTTDGSKWANAFCRATGFPDEGWALTWFCNAIMAQYDQLRRTADDDLTACQRELEHERHEKETVADAAKAHTDWSRLDRETIKLRAEAAEAERDRYKAACESFGIRLAPLPENANG